MSFKKDVLRRDNNICQNCKSKSNLTLFFIDFNRKNKDFDNVITVCKKCLARALRPNIRKEYWMNFYGQKLKESKRLAKYKQSHEGVDERR